MYASAVDRAVEQLARRQHGVFSRAQAKAVGATADIISHRVSKGTWKRRGAGVYVLPSHVLTFERQCMAAHLATPGSAVAGLAAAHLHCLTGFAVARPEVVVPPARRGRSPLATVHRQSGYRTTEVDGIPVTTVAQTLVDIAGRVPLLRLERAMDDAIVRRWVTVAELEERMAFYAKSRRAGIGVFRALVSERTAEGWVPTESALEQALDVVLDQLPSRPRIIRQPALPWRPAARQRCDRLLADWRTIVEADGRRWHTRVADFDRDLWRDNEAQAHGYRILRFTYAHLTSAPEQVVDIVEQTGGWSMSA